MYLFYLFSLIPIIIGFILFLSSKRIVWQEWIGGTVAALLVSGLMHGIAIVGMTDDIETWSGQIVEITHLPKWTEEYKHAVYKTETYSTGTGKNRRTHTRRVFSHYETRHATHPESFSAILNFGTINDTKAIDQKTYEDIKKNFGGKEFINGKQSTSHGGHFDGGDNNIYVVQNKTKYIYPATIIRHFENRIKAAPTVFSYAKVPPNISVYQWPENTSRLLGENKINILEFDRMNSRLGPSKKVNVIIANFGSKDGSISKYQEAAWIGGKKNDLVLCYGQKDTNNVAQWAYCFGWTKKEICKRSLETILMTHPIDNTILPIIEMEIRKNYQIRDWSEFDYITIDPPTWSYIMFFIVMMLSQVFFWSWARGNNYER